MKKKKLSEFILAYGAILGESGPAYELHLL